MPLDSSDTLIGAAEGKLEDEQDKACTEREACVALSWCYLRLRHTQMEEVNNSLSRSFPTFVHTNIVYHREKKGVSSEERPTIPGLLFVQGKAKEVQTFLNGHFSGIYLSKDCTTGQVAVIRDSIMQSFMKVAQVAPTRIRFLQHSLEHYADGHHKVRLTSGILAGFEGYCVRISRDRCLVTSVGGITISIGGINRETFENAKGILLN